LAKSEGFDEDIIFFEEFTLPQKVEKLGCNVKARINSEILHYEENFSVCKWLKKKYYCEKPHLSTERNIRICLRNK